MGNLHTLRRAILRDPNRWKDAARWFRWGARQDAKGEWYPTGENIPRHHNPHYHFIQHTLRGDSSTR